MSRSESCLQLNLALQVEDSIGFTRHSRVPGLPVDAGANRRGEPIAVRLWGDGTNQDMTQVE